MWRKKAQNRTFGWRTVVRGLCPSWGQGSRGGRKDTVVRNQPGEDRDNNLEKPPCGNERNAIDSSVIQTRHLPMTDQWRPDQRKMPPAKTGKRKSRDAGQAHECDARPIGKVQPGLLAAKPKYGAFVTVRGAEAYRREILALVRRLQQYGNAAGERTWSVVGFDPELWENWQDGDICLEKRPDGEYLISNSTKFVNTGGNVFFFLKSESMDHIEGLMKMVADELGAYQNVSYEVQDAERGHNRVIGGLFADGLANPTDVESIEDFIITTDGDMGSPGGSYMLTQKFVFNWTILGDMSQDELENMIGKTMTDDILVADDPRRHIKCAHILDSNRKHPLIFRQSMPYGLNKTGIGREEGTFYISCANTCQRFLDILKNLVKLEDKLISTVHAEEGSFWYIPSAEELGLTPIPVRDHLTLMAQWNVRSDNGYMFYNSREYMYRMTTGGYRDPQDTPSSRVLKLAGLVFSDWQRSWIERNDEPHIPHLDGFLKDEDKTLLAKYDNAIPIRKGLATFYTLQSIVTSPFYSRAFDLYRIYPDEVIVGVMPGFAFGLGKRVMPYLNQDEQIPAYQMGVTEAAAIGHVVPDFQVILDRGLQSRIYEMATKAASTQARDKSVFFLSAAQSLMGVQAYIESYARLADKMSREDKFTEQQRANLRGIRDRMYKLAKDKPDTFLEAAQLVFTMHCCLHIVGEATSIGRLDKLLGPYYDKGQLTMEETQEIIDCFWIKIGERTLLNRHAAQDKIFPGMSAVPYKSNGNFPQGGGMNQWGQQLTIGGYLPNDDEVPTSACNEVTLMCLRAARRLPLNAPCLTLRLHRGISQEVLDEAAKALLSGGAHPVLLHDDRLVPGLQQSGRRGVPVSLTDARNYACDGCFEPVFVGASEFAFCTFSLLDAVEMALNEGTLYSKAGPTFLRGSKRSFPSPKASEIKSFPEFQEILLQHLRLQIPLLVSSLIGGYGNIWKVCPSPLLSVMMKGCVESGRDHANGGALYHNVGFMFVAGSTAIDSLYAIKKLVYDPLTALTTLPDLLTCLKCDWGYDMKEYLIDVRAGTGRAEAQAKFFKHLRNFATALPKFGHGENAELKELATWLFENVLTILRESFDNAPTGVKETFERLERDYSLPGRPFGFVALPGIGTFEGYVGFGLNSGASADGRRSGQPIASDLSPAPVPQDLPAHPDTCEIYKALQCWDLDVINVGLSCGSEVDLLIREDFPLDELTDFLRHYSDLDLPIGSNVITITCANPDTLQKASQKSDPYELVRVRQGGWSEFFITLFPEHQGQHQRRMYVKP